MEKGSECVVLLRKLFFWKAHMITSLLSTWLLQRLTKCLKEGLLPFPELVCYVGGRFPPAKLKGVQREAIAVMFPVTHTSIYLLHITAILNLEKHGLYYYLHSNQI